MCRTWDNFATMVHSETRKARKSHQCMECRRVIERGESYLDEAWTFEGEFSTGKTCSHCQSGRAWLLRECHSFTFGEVYDELREHWIEENIHTRELAWLIWGMGRKWRKRNGKLMEVK